MYKEPAARRLNVNGSVQGVGCRPFVYQLARRYGLKGEVSNTASGVSIHVEGAADALDGFARELSEKGPPLSLVTEMRVEAETLRHFRDFSIAESRGDAAMETLISPDVSVCADCLRELFDPRDRRYRYPFINCTNCGPRYTIIDDIPYDRPHTSMKHFAMCGDCLAEYRDPMNRRFHAQPNACPVCGPRVSLFTREGAAIDAADPIAAAAEALRSGRIAAVKGLGGFHLAADARNPEAVARLRERKRREEKPFALMSMDLGRIRDYAWVGPEEEALLTSPQRPIVLLRKRLPEVLAPEVAPGNRFLGVMLPYTPLHYLLLSMDFTALVMTSGNLSEEPIAIENADAFKRLSDLADVFLVHDRDIYLRSDDSILRRAAGETRLIRRSRGYVPRPVFLKDRFPPVLAVGAELKNTVCLIRGDRAFLSQHIGDLENPATLDFFEQTIGHMKRILEIEPEIIAHDLHPDYLSTRWAESQAASRVAVQHHHAHIVSCLAENRVDGPVIGLSFDGTGYGPDGTIWGGEVLLAEARGFRRLAHLATVPMPGAASAVREPWRMALAYLWAAFGEAAWGLHTDILRRIPREKTSAIAEMIRTGLNSPRTSSLGRLFDGVAALVGLGDRVSFEGQAAMALEMASAESPHPAYPVDWSPGSQAIPVSPIIRGVVGDLDRGIPAAVIGSRFHRTLIELFTGIADGLRKETGVGRAALSGGVFQNTLLLAGLKQGLEAIGFQVFTHRQVPANDGGISLGQAVSAASGLGG